MIVDIKIDLSECYPENIEYDSDMGAIPQSSLSDEVIAVIKSEVKNAISRQICSDVEKFTKDAYEKFGNEKIKSIIDFKMNEFLKKGMVKKNSYTDEEVTVDYKLKNIFDNSNDWNGPFKKIEEIGKKFAEECRKRYDLSFASNIVAGLDKQGLLKDGAYQAITSHNTD